MAVGIAAIGAVIGSILAIWWFVEASRCCGVVRFYEYVAGGLVVGICVIGDAVGLGVAWLGRRRNTKTLMVIGCIITILTNAGVLVVGAKAVHDHLLARLAQTG